MPITLEELQIKFSAEMNNLNPQLASIKNQLGGLEANTVKAQSAFSKLAKAGLAIGGAMIARELFQVGKESLQMANDAVESEQLFSVSMGNMESSARAWSESLSSSLGLNSYELRKNVGMLNTMFGSMGLGEQEAYNMATGMTELANDMASFYNLSTDEAFDKLRAGITGETEPLKRLGILVDENTIKQYAMKNGISKTGKELTQQQKLQARYGAIMEQTSKAQGDLARTMDSPTNQLRKLNAQFDMAKIALGQALQPALIAVLPVLTSFATGLSRVLSGAGVTTGNPFSDVVISLADATASITSGVTSLSQEAVAKIKTLKADVETALADYATAAGKTKSVVIGIELKPQTTGYENVMNSLDDLKNYVDGATAQPIIVSIDVLMKAALQDGKVTPEEIQKARDALKKQVDDLLAKTKKDQAAAHAEINVKYAAGEIETEQAFNDAHKAVDEEYGTLIEGINLVYTLADADLQVGKWNAVQLNATDRDNIKKVIEAEVNAGDVVLVKAEAAVEGIFGGAGQAGQTFLDYYAGLVDEARTLGEKIKKAAEEGMTEGASPEFLANLAKKRREYAEQQNYLTSGIVQGSQLNLALSDFNMNPESIKNVLDAFQGEFGKEKKSEGTWLSDMKTMGSKSMFDPKFLEKLKTDGFVDEKGEASYQAWIASLEKDSADRLAAYQNDMVSRLLSIAGDAKGIDTSGMGIIELSAMQQSLKGLLDKIDPEALTGDSVQAYKDLADAYAEIEAAYQAALKGLPFVPQNQNYSQPKPGAMAPYNPYTPTFTKPFVNWSGYGSGYTEKSTNITIAPLTVTANVVLESGVVLGRATVIAQQQLQKSAGGGGVWTRQTQ